jgi:Glycosyl transferase family 2
MTEENLEGPGYTTADQENTTPPPTAPESPAATTSIEESQRPPIASAPLSVVLVAYNDRPTVTSVVADWAACLNRLSREYEILLVDDGSSDGTGDLADSLASPEVRLKVLRHNTHQGIGASLRTGLGSARLPLVCYSTCSGEYDASDLERLLPWIDQTDLVGGCRVGASGVRWRTLQLRTFRWLARVLFAVRMRDPECLFLLARRSIFARIPIQSSGPFAPIEILAKANFLGCMMSEAPVTYRPRAPAGSSSRGRFRSMLGELTAIFFRPSFGPRDLPSAAPPVSPQPTPEAEPQPATEA